jgi:hypothetical protein
VAASYRCQLVSKEEVTMTLARSRRMLLVAVGLSVAVAAFPATAAHAGQPPAGETQLTQGPTSQPPVDLVPPGDPVPVDPPVDDILYPPDQPEPPQPPDPPVGPDDLANPTENPEPQPPDDGDQSIPTPERVDTGLGGEADRSDGPAVPVAAFPLALAVLLLALVAGWRLGATRSAR